MRTKPRYNCRVPLNMVSAEKIIGQVIHVWSGSQPRSLRWKFLSYLYLMRLIYIVSIHLKGLVDITKMPQVFIQIHFNMKHDEIWKFSSISKLFFFYFYFLLMWMVFFQPYISLSIINPSHWNKLSICKIFIQGLWAMCSWYITPF